ncbi:hypothetical protein FEM03_09455 [Phragmitibacter flavus]|uniref:DNA methylase adenine-specific domain-containing protein n=1 Tax=Phragmitibacter flavus TaxID=2576071 RepID=A0A5R8KHP0_9BACT|nr:N-6 DNA methylase [Phragmitibacter flavus]TLD71129.1 hypothetical protein FEM03_09455 [Phragmitibacter flavus]
MQSSNSQAFIGELEKKLWTTADKLWSNLDAAVYGKESGPITRRLAAINMAICGIDFGKQPADTVTRDQLPEFPADILLANQPFIIKELGNGVLEGEWWLLSKVFKKPIISAYSRWYDERMYDIR